MCACRRNNKIHEQPTSGEIPIKRIVVNVERVRGVWGQTNVTVMVEKARSVKEK
jgi:hypothetical protein